MTVTMYLLTPLITLFYVRDLSAQDRTNCVGHYCILLPQFLIGVTVSHVIRLACTKTKNEVSVSPVWGSIEFPAFLTRKAEMCPQFPAVLCSIPLFAPDLARQQGH